MNDARKTRSKTFHCNRLHTRSTVATTSLEMKPQITSTVVKLCQAEDTVSSELAKDPALAPGEAATKLYGNRSTTGKQPQHEKLGPASAEDLKQALSCGRWGPTGPGELFLRVYHDVLTCVEVDPVAGVVSPPLLGSYGTNPLTVIAPLVDIARHMANVIVRAKRLFSLLVLGRHLKQ